MRKSHFKEAQIIGIIKEQEAGMATGCSSHMLRTQCCNFTGGFPPLAKATSGSTCPALSCRSDSPQRLSVAAIRPSRGKSVKLRDLQHRGYDVILAIAGHWR